MERGKGGCWQSEEEMEGGGEGGEEKKNGQCLSPPLTSVTD